MTTSNWTQKCDDEFEKLFRVYLTVRLHFLTGYDSAKYGVMRNKWIKERQDIGLVKFLVKQGIDTPRKMLKCCVGNFLYENDNCLYDEAFTISNYKRHEHFLRNKRELVRTDIDRIELLSYNYKNGLTGYFESIDIINDILSLKIYRETLSYFLQVYPEMKFGTGLLADRINERIGRSKLFLPISDEIRGSIQTLISDAVAMT